jgi:hypothetical protein
MSLVVHGSKELKQLFSSSWIKELKQFFSCSRIKRNELELHASLNHIYECLISDFLVNVLM